MNDLGLYQENQYLRAQIRKLQNENSTLRGLTGRHKRLAVKAVVIKILDANPDTPSNIVAARAKCTVRYVNKLKKELYRV